MNTLPDIEEFLAIHRVAVVGVSSNPRDFTRHLFRELLDRGYDAVPVHPGIQEMEGRVCYDRLSEVAPPVEGALLLTAPEVTQQVVQECARAGIHRVWMYRAGGAGAVNPKAVEFCAQNGIRLVEGECPFMFLPHAALIHKIHGFCRKLTGRYPLTVPPQL